MVDYVVTQRAPARTRARAREVVAARAGSTGCCSPRSVAIVGYGLWAIDGITKFDVTGDPDYYVMRQAVYALLGRCRLGRRVPDRPGALPPAQQASSSAR